MLRQTSLVFFLFFWAVSPVQADFSCSAAINYQWNKDEKDIRKVAWSEVAGQAVTEDGAKAQVSAAAAKEIPRAREACARDHENLSGCISAKFSAQSTLMAKLSFAARKALEEAITSDCRAAQGTCGEVLVLETKCVEIKAAEAPAAGKADEKTKGGGEEKKKAK